MQNTNKQSVSFAVEYGPGGMLMPGRHGALQFNSSTSSWEFVIDGDGNYRHGYQGSEKDNEIYGKGNLYSTFFRELDVRTLRWWSNDPEHKKTPWESPYMSMGGNPIWHNDILVNTAKRVEGDPPGNGMGPGRPGSNVCMRAPSEHQYSRSSLMAGSKPSSTTPTADPNKVSSGPPLINSISSITTPLPFSTAEGFDLLSKKFQGNLNTFEQGSDAFMATKQTVQTLNTFSKAPERLVCIRQHRLLKSITPPKQSTQQLTNRFLVCRDLHTIQRPQPLLMQSPI